MNYKEVVKIRVQNIMMHTALFKHLCMVCSHLNLKNAISVRDKLMTLEIYYTRVVFEVTGPSEWIMLSFCQPLLQIDGWSDFISQVYFCCTGVLLL